MRFSHNWLSELAPGLPAPEALAERLLLLGLEVSGLERTGPAFTGVVVGEVLTKEKHPNADRLSVCTVSDGAATHAVVCGAPNVAAGQRVAFARVGAQLPGGLKIKKSKIRGSVSEGMICSTDELGLPDDGVDGIMVLSADAALGRDFAATLGPGDAFLEVEVTPNRPDCLSHLGLARELAVHFGLAVRVPEAPAFAEDGPAPLPVEGAAGAPCPRYTGRLVAGVKVAPSPAAWKSRLEACGLRPINNVVDATNLLLLERGQPVHAFDADKLAGGRLSVRDAKAGETLKALDGKVYELTPEDLVIADDSGPVAIAGVIGGEPTGVTEGTTNVFLECARFAPGRVRRTARRLGIRTDSSYRFERGVDPTAQPEAARRLAALVLEAAGGTAGPLLDTAPAAAAPAVIAASAAALNAILGTSYPEGDVLAVLARLSATPLGTPPAVTVPSWRLDLAAPEDLAEEVARHLGYDKIPEAAGPATLPVPADLPVPSLAERLADVLAGLGFQEAFCYDFLSEKELERLFGPAGVIDRLDRRARPEDLARLLNPLSDDWAALRPTLLGGLLRSAVLNQNRGAGGGRLFETGRVYSKAGEGVAEGTRLAVLWWGPWPERAHWRRAPASPDVHEAAGLAEALLRPRALTLSAGALGDGLFHPKASAGLSTGGRSVGRLGELHPDALRRWELRGPAVALELDLEALAAAMAPACRFAPVSAFPSVERDLSLLVDEGAPFAAVRDALRPVANLERLELIDVFRGKDVPAGKVSWTVRLSFSSLEKTLDDAAISAAMGDATALLDGKATLRAA